MLAWGESFACLLAYLLTPSAHHLSQPLHLSKSAPSIYLTTHLSIYLYIHLPALITPHRLLFSFRTVLPFSAFIFFHRTLHSIYSGSFFFDSSNLFALHVFICQASKPRKARLIGTCSFISLFKLLGQMECPKKYFVSRGLTKDRIKCLANHQSASGSIWIHRGL